MKQKDRVKTQAKVDELKVKAKTEAELNYVIRKDGIEEKKDEAE